MFDKFHLSFNFKFKVSHDVFKNKNVSFQFLECQLMSGFFLHMSHYMTNSKSCMSIYVHFIFVQVLRVKCQKVAKTLSKVHTHP